jgi:hypothetical protein
LRTSYSEIKGLSPERVEFPDFMDPNFRTETKNYMAAIMSDVKDYHSVLAVDMDQRWLFGVDWDGGARLGVPRLGPEGIRYLPQWLEKRYTQISQLNKVWNKSYQQFSDVIQDPEIIRGEKIQDLDRKPWRLDLIEYTLWTINDFLKELTAAMRAVNPNHLITVTSELPEVIPFPISTKDNSGIDFVSPVHYNHMSDYGRDWVGNARLIVQSKFLSDLSGLPSYINETGFRTKPLRQRPPNLNYAMSRLDDNEHKAQLYLEQMSLMSVYPWLAGWSYFKWYDKWPEGDFGYLEDDGSLKPISRLGQLVNEKFQINLDAEKKPQAVIFYPSYALAAPKAGFQQYKSLTLMLGHPFLKEHKKMLADALSVLKDLQSLEGISLGILSNLLDAFKEKWFSFAFVQEVKNSPAILLAGGTLEMLSMEDRARLLKAKTMSFGPIGLYDERFNSTSPWYLEAVGIPPEAYEEKIHPQDLGFNQTESQNAICPKDKASFILPPSEGGVLKFVSCAGQTLEIPQGIYTNVDLLMASSAGDVTEKIVFNYSDGTQESQYIAPTIGDYRFPPTFNHYGWKGIVEGEKEGYLSHIRVPCNSTRSLVSITLPNELSLQIYGLSLVEGGVSHNNNIIVHWGDKQVRGVTSWLLSLKEGVGDYETLATFENGRPAIVRSRDGHHVAFLYDPLTWKGASNEISQDLEFHSALIMDLLKKIEEAS